MDGKLKNQPVNLFTKGMWRDSLPSLQPDGTYREAWNAVLESDEENSFGISNEGSNELHVKVPGEVRGLLFAEERDQYIVFTFNEGKGELGIIDNKKKCYIKITDSDKLDLSCEEWVDAEIKYMQPCNQLHLYFSTNDVYKFVNLDDPCCEFEIKELLKVDCIPTFDFQIYKRGGALPNGTYWFAAKLRDAEGNDTNWFQISKGIHISGGDHKPGEISKKAINIKLDGLHRDYSLIDIAVISTVRGETAVEHVDTLSYGEGKVDYLYRGRTGRELPLSLQQIRSRNPRYIKGKNLMQYDGRLVLYNIRSEHNLNYQKQANEIVTKYVNYVIPSRYADQFKGLRPNENYWFGIKWNYIDGTSSVAFDIPGRAATAEEEALTADNCSNCELPKWRTSDTSKREKTFLEDVHTTNQSYDDDISFGDNNRDSNYKDTDLDEDENDAIDIPVSDEPTEDEMGAKELNEARDSIQSNMDCLCDYIISLHDVDRPGCNFCEDDDAASWATLQQLYCMCISRTVSDEPEGEGGAGMSVEEIAETSSIIMDALGSWDGGSCQGNCGGGNCGQGGCGSCGGNGCGGAGGTSCGGGCGSTGCDKVVETFDNSFYTSVEGRALESDLRYTLKRLQEEYYTHVNDMSALQPCHPDNGCQGCTTVITTQKCSVDGLEICYGGICKKCVGGVWHVQSGLNTYEVRDSYQRDSNNRKPEGEAKKPGAENFSFEYVYDADGCEIVGVKPSKYSEGSFGYWETKQLYPLTKDCECNYIYGNLAGKPVRLHRVPSVSKEPHFVSFSGGVPNLYDMSNMEDKDSFVFLIGPKFENITVPENLPKPLCHDNPYSIVYVERTEGNKSVIGTGIAISTFKGEVQGEPFVFPKIGVNSFERFHRAIEPTGVSTFRGGVGVYDATTYDLNPANVSPYIIHSADFHFRQPPLDATDALFELELSGQGFRHGLYAEDIESETFTRGKKNQKGTRQSLLLNHYRLVRGADDGYVSRCVTSMSEVDADSNVSKSDEFSYSLCNLWGESCVYTELEGPFTKFVEGDKDGMGGKYGGVNHNGDEASDRSFTGDTLCHSMPIHDVRSHLVTFTRYLPNQYGSPITQTFIPIGLEGTPESLESGVSEGLCGDSFVGAVSFRRTSYVSDKTNRKIFKRIWNENVIGLRFKFLGRLLDYILRTLGLKLGGYVPESCDVGEHINKWGGLREHGDTGAKPGPTSEQWGEKTRGQIPLPKGNGGNPSSRAQDRNLGDNYWPHVVKSNVWTWMNSDVNPAYRELGDPDNMEVYWPKLKGQRLDSSMPDRYDWAKSYLNRFYSFLETNPKWKLLVTALLLFLFVWGIGLWIVFEGVMNLINGLQAIGGGTYGLQTIGGAVAAALGIVLIFIGIKWIGFWARSDMDNRMIEDLVGLKNIRPDVKNPDGSYSMYDGRIVQFEDNFWSHNPDLSATNRYEFVFGMSDTYQTCICPEERSIEAPYSNKQNPVSHIDSWSNFKMNNTIKLPPDNGKISKIFKLGGKVFVHTTDMLLDLQTGNRSATLDKGKLLLGSGDIFGNAEPIYGGVVEGYAGLSDPNSAHVTNWGYIFPDREARQFFLFSGQGPTPISDNGVRGFLQENMYFKLLEKFPDFKHVDNKSSLGIGYSIGVDHKHNRFLFTKVDYDVHEGVDMVYEDGCLKVDGHPVKMGDPKHFCNKSFTLSYHPTTQQWVSFHSYVPKLYAWDRFNMFSFNSEGMHLHNVKGSFQNFYGERFPFTVEFPVRSQQGDAFETEAFVLDTEAYTWKGCDYVRNSKITFDKVMLYDSYQNTGDLVIDTGKDNLSVLDRSKERTGVIYPDFTHRVWLFNNNFNDILKDPDELQFECDCEVGPVPVRKGALGSSLSSNKFKDNFMMYRFSFQSHDDVKLFLKKMKSKVDLSIGYFE